MDSTITPLATAIVGGIVRKGLVVAGTYFITEGYTNHDDWTMLSMKAAPILAALMWSAYQKLQSYAATRIAMQMHSDSTMADVKDGLKECGLSEKLALATMTDQPDDRPV